MVNDPARLYLHGKLNELFPELTAYYSPPGDLILERPCIVYSAQQLEPSYANNLPYSIGRRFQITFLTDRPGVDGLDDMFRIPNVAVSNHQSFTKEDVTHDIFIVTINKI